LELLGPGGDEMAVSVSWRRAVRLIFAGWYRRTGIRLEASAGLKGEHGNENRCCS
jgi:hypothetical protein